MRDPEARQQTLLKALELSEQAVAADEEFGTSYTLKGNILFDLGRMDDALPTLLKGIEVDESKGYRLNAENFMTPAMIILTQAVAYDIDSSVWSPRFIDLMRRAAAVDGAPADYAKLCATLADNVETYCRWLQASSESDERKLILRKLNAIANDVTELRLASEAPGRERYWEVYLFSAWHVTEGWGEFPAKPGEDPISHQLRRLERGLELADLALELRPTLSLAVMLKGYVSFEISKLRALQSAVTGTPALTDAAQIHQVLVGVSSESLALKPAQIRTEYLNNFPYVLR